jgi:hypothetical protein
VHTPRGIDKLIEYAAHVAKRKELPPADLKPREVDKSGVGEDR